MKRIRVLFIAFIIMLGFSSCQKEAINENIVKAESETVRISSSEDGILDVFNEYIPISSTEVLEADVRVGGLFYGENWIGWLDPELVDPDEDLPLEEIYKEDAVYYGYKTEIGGSEAIVCPRDGEGCGRLYVIDGSSGVRYIGLYLESID